MAIKGLKDLLKVLKGDVSDEEVKTFEEGLNKALPETHVPKTTFNEKLEAEKMLKKQLEDSTKTLEELKAKGNLSAEYQKQLEDLKKAQAEDKAKYDSELKKMRLSSAIDLALTTAKAKDAKMVKSLLDEAKMVLSEDGTTVAGLKEQIDKIKTDKAWAFDIDGEPDNNQDKQKQPSFGNPPNNKTGANAAEAAINAAFGL